jgi:hypothetical protein
MASTSSYRKIDIHDVPQSYDDDAVSGEDALQDIMSMSSSHHGSHSLHNSLHGSSHGGSHHDTSNSYLYSKSPALSISPTTIDTPTDYYSPVNTNIPPTHTHSGSPRRPMSTTKITTSRTNSPQISTSREYEYNSEDEEEEDLGRYSVIYDPSRSSQHNTRNTSSFHGTSHTDNQNNSHNTKFNSFMPEPAKRFFRRVQDARMESRRRRLERLLALPDDPNIRFHMERFGLCCNSWCDILDKGMYPVLLVLIGYVVTLIVLGEEYAMVKKLMLGIGIPLFIFRISWRPLSWLICELRTQRVSRIMDLNCDGLSCCQ